MDPLRRNLLECSKCTKTFKTNHQFKKHISTHDPDAKVKCEVFGKISKNPATLSSHMSQIHGPSICNICKKSLSSSRALKGHVNRVHSTVDRPRITCTFPGCEKTYLNKHDVTKHQRFEHSVNPVRFRCTLCGKEFKTRTELHSHIPTHTTEKPFKCSKCARIFARMLNMKRHEATHLDKSVRHKFQCAVCLQTFVTGNGLQGHIRNMHENQKNYACSFCAKRFAGSSDLKRHLEARHPADKEKIHSCDKCEYRSHSKVNLAGHVRRHNSANWRECYFCRKQFTNFPDLVKHFGRIHTLEK